jgi:glycosyltransferase involved in cell wall biosynthesis
LREAVDSIPPSLHGLSEIIIVDDGSSEEETIRILARLLEQGVKVVRQENRGLGAARNFGIQHALGRYLLPLDADNRLRADYLHRGVAILDEDPAVDVVYGDAEYFGEKTGRWKVGSFSLPLLLSSNYIDACAVFRKAAWDRCGGYDEHMPVQGHEDWDLWCRIACSGGRFHYAEEVLFDYRVRNDSMSVSMRQKERMEEVYRYVRNKTIQITIGEFLSRQLSWEMAVVRFRANPIRMLVNLFFRSFLPGVHKILRKTGDSKRDLGPVPSTE